MSDISQDRLEHLAFMREITVLRDRIFAALQTHPTSSEPGVVQGRWDEIKTYGDEPVFQSLLFDRMIQEAAERA